ncbi:flagellar hook-basal body complex protein FliE [Cohaesibacter celericrescens]|uniref:Flagellar hook-basal body complex protein FliE n=1 Tax=Cohaesibacter celericrescens TaxID=2067669 RepID=A0A2N5XWL7_9HYPH|nr:flagellar hook-basal body complex protein FliE [Cohaesibacter celericrescens]PLW75493.1 flagellar hook-basal body protein FliE [Cohaesibacter celericrescens]PLW78900.1 flagellar hook-basal body protein FliE [Cohaesibacter celericrescens]
MIDALNATSSLSSPTTGMNNVSESRFVNTDRAAVNVTGDVDETGQSFTDYFAKVSTDAIQTIKQGESASIASIQGKQSVQSVVEAVMNAELTLQSAIAIRNKIVTAYQEVSRMAI